MGGASVYNVAMYAVLLSGGVDSSVALGLLRRQVSDPVEAYYLKVWLEDELSYLGKCPWEEDLSYAEAVASSFDVPLRVVSLQREYHDEVVRYVLDELRCGRTPSPDLFCNADIKFKAFLSALPDGGGGVEKIVTGHYARIEHLPATSPGPRLLRAPDDIKDQTYFLSRLSSDQLGRAVFPLGTYSKGQVRALAEEWQLPNRARPDSQGICFLGKIRYGDFVAHHLGSDPGPIIDVSSGNTLGEHRGHWFYTIGQRQGLGLGGGPWYVVGKRIDENAILVAHAEAERTNRTHRFRVRGLNIIGSGTQRLTPRSTAYLAIKVRHGPGFLKGRLSLEGEAAEGGVVELDQPERGVADGQFAVFYDDQECVASGIIQRL